MKKFSVLKLALAFGAALGVHLAAAPAQAQATLDAVKKRGKILCGVSPVSAGFSFADDKGVRRGFDSDVCRAISAAVFGDPEKVESVPLSTNVRFQALQSGEIDVLSRQTTWTFSRDNSLGLDFGPIVFYDGQGLMVPAKLGVKSADRTRERRRLRAARHNDAAEPRGLLPAAQHQVRVGRDRELG